MDFTAASSTNFVLMHMHAGPADHQHGRSHAKVKRSFGKKSCGPLLFKSWGKSENDKIVNEPQLNSKTFTESIRAFNTVENNKKLIVTAGWNSLIIL
jgi:hypothetical protein